MRLGLAFEDSKRESRPLEFQREREREMRIEEEEEEEVVGVSERMREK